MSKTTRSVESKFVELRAALADARAGIGVRSREGGTLIGKVGLLDHAAAGHQVEKVEEACDRVLGAIRALKSHYPSK